ncbi:lipopolysaccharide heptosyltransferase I [Humisphaera borealis]|uniref:Lipopolysaccharide heptosyltransferase 1 n=1 Tax=Humisphaera borealis TaxID=2807512 RepID=A0A7M2WZY6_9BACT|nr:lipopolysaccharide heptosyltransferase I [Humisphaera borealis]QOV90040.1 lipopolysaccharide heptosyltransferase I [Humisphaera borealis]
MQRIPFQTSPRRVLIVKPSAIGDVVHTLPILKLVKNRWPLAEVSWLVTPACAGILDQHPLLHEVIRFDRKMFGRSWRQPSVLRSLFEFGERLKRRRFDVAIDLQGLFRSGWLTFQTAAPIRIGLSDAREFATLFYTHRITVGRREQHAIERYLSVAEAIGAGRGPVEFPFATTAADEAFVRDRVPAKYALLFPGTNWATKRWPVEKFAALVARLKQRFGLETVVGGAPNEVDLAAKIPTAVNLAGRTTLNQLVALIARSAVVISNDSGPMHIAAALGRPLVAPFGPTNPIRTGPYGRLGSVVKLDLPCSPCYSRHCSHQSCLQWLEIDAVLRVVERELTGSY